MSGITKTIPQARGRAGVESLYDGTFSEFEFHMRGKPSKLGVGDYVYTIFQDEMIGRCQIKGFVFDHVNEKGKKQTLIMVECPGERFDPPYPYKGHRGTRYFREE